MPITDKEIKDLKVKAKQLRKDEVDVTTWSGGAHIGGSLSVTDILVVLYYKYMNIDPKNPQKEDRDRLVLSKGHTALAYVCVLADRGFFEKEELKNFNKFKSPFGMHPDGNKVVGCDASTGSLGHGLPMAVGMAMANKLKKIDAQTYCILGDGECAEGTIWEGAMAAAHFKLSNLVTIVDRNRLQIDGSTEDVMGLEPFADKWKAFGHIVKEVDGHNFKELGEALEFAHGQNEGPVVIIANTVKGKGIDFMENEAKWHYGGLDSDLSEKAKKSIDKM
jgi:transketolase